MTRDGEPAQRYGWFTNKDGSRSYFGGGSETPLPGPSASPGPIHIRMFVDDVSGESLWAVGAIDPGDLPLSESVRAELRAWVDDWTRFFQDTDFDDEAHDWRGYALSLRVQEDLGPEYQVRFMPQSRAVEDALKAQASD